MKHSMKDHFSVTLVVFHPTLVSAPSTVHNLYSLKWRLAHISCSESARNRTCPNGPPSELTIYLRPIWQHNFKTGSLPRREIFAGTMGNESHSIITFQIIPNASKQLSEQTQQQTR